MSSPEASLPGRIRAPAVVRSSVHRRQMETRLRLRRRLLRVDADDRSREERSTRRMLSSGSSARQEAWEEDDEGDSDAEDEDADDEEEDENDRDGETIATCGPTGIKPKSDKCEQATIVKLLFSRSDPRGRPPTVWFDYPPHLLVTRESLATATGNTSRLINVNSTDCELLYKTHWERNCVKNAFAIAGFRRTKKKWNAWNVAWAKHMSRDKFKFLKANQAFCHFPDPWVIGRKDRLMKTLTSCKRRFGACYAFHPEGFTLPDHLDAFKRATGSNPSSLWILKPPAAACGRGIRVMPASEVDQFLTNKNNQERKYVAQRYLSNPLLVNGFKFDLRIYVLVTSVDPLRIYLFEEGLTRFCTTPYALSNTKNRFAHLTNYSVNKSNKSFVENVNADSANTGNKWSMTALLEHLHERGIVDDVVDLRSQIKDVIRKTVIAAEAHLTPLTHQFVKGFRSQNIKCFELFGFDLMLDKSCKPWLIEVNVSPSLMAGSPLDKKVKGLLLSDIFHLVGIPIARSKLPPGTIPTEFEPDQMGSTSGTSPSPPSANINKQLHETVLDPKRPYFEKKDLELFTQSDWTIIHDMEDEMERLGHFERIFPCETAKETSQYSPFFTCQRYSNALCSKWIETKNRLRPEVDITPRRQGKSLVTGKKSSQGCVTSNSRRAISTTMRNVQVNRLVTQTSSR